MVRPMKDVAFVVVSHATYPKGTSMPGSSWDPLHACTWYEKQ